MKGRAGYLMCFIATVMMNPKCNKIEDIFETRMKVE